MHKKLFWIIAWICLSMPFFGQVFSSIKCIPPDNILGHPVIRLNSDDKLQVSFDEISSETRNLEYRFVLCNANWEPASLQPIQYIRGSNYTAISDIRFSINTRTDYTHYEFSFPDDYTQFLVSGNYRCEIYDVNDPETTLLGIHFFVTENAVSINAKIIPPKRLEYRRSRQELEFEITSSRFDILQPYQNLTVLIQQNGRNDHVRKVSPKYIIGKTLKFTDSEDLIFDGNDEFRNFDSRFLTFNGYGIEDIATLNNQYFIKVHPAESRATKTYSDDEDLNGRFHVRADQRPNPEIEAEYTYVYFSLSSQNLGSDIGVHVYGALTDWQINEFSEMTYNFEKNCYEKTLFLKQGFYDFLYVHSNKKLETIDLTRFEGNHQETGNEYTIYVYYRGNSDSHDRLIGTSVLNSNE